METLDYNELAVPGVRQLEPYTPGKPIDELEREYGVRDSIKLASNENPLGASPLALDAVRKAVDELWLYPDANGYHLKAALAEKHGVDPACITLGNGSNDVLVFLAQAFLGPGLKAVFSQYCFAVYPIATQMVGRRGLGGAGPARRPSDGARPRPARALPAGRCRHPAGLHRQPEQSDRHLACPVNGSVISWPRCRAT